ncbi:MAG: NAD(P)/FAD-dependent oxidoreductase [Geminocystis sp.]|nr:NAD(P)/FAD-dependent oxidoreductase [Geminocystis sp.]MCS7148841.1 NAD(P)/FAD-dependent oxidoreductase [Geminocystis sp.]MCX8077398.1 NAD(P)/FAD-dependent oxidoreductase [Geminocystis sp.]MDW8115925.1 NAD(P)/FAD-dependent oxidoreductase [Geminocystis sp.]MDW8463734.1 NAD(P)/FAD-dependent oxidoreductase [Geminocystis sp.]
MKTEIVIIGSGIGGLCCGAILAKYGYDVVVCESHNLPGGCAHAFTYKGFKFEAGPSLYSGLSYSPSPNPLRQVLDMIGEDIEWKNYKSWGCWLPEGYFEVAVGEESFYRLLLDLRGKEAANQWRVLQKIMKPLSDAATSIPVKAFRYDMGVVITLLPYLPSLLPHVFFANKLTASFGTIMDEVVSDEFIRNWLNLLCFMLSGLPAHGTSAAEMAFMFADWYRPNVTLDYPAGGSEAIVNALVRGIKKFGGKLLLSCHVKAVLVENNRAIGVRLANGEIISASKAVVSNASIWDTLSLIPEEVLPPKIRQKWLSTPANRSFMHLHLGIDGKDIPTDLPCHHLVVNHWQITAEQNVVAVSIPTLLDSSLAPPGSHSIHAYTPATEPYQLWENLTPNTPEYEEMKEKRALVMWQALERFIPDIRERCRVRLIGTPLTHSRYLRRYRGTYGPAWDASKGFFPPSTTPIPNFYLCGDSTFPGIGVPAVAASGMITANTIASVWQHLSG